MEHFLQATGETDSTRTGTYVQVVPFMKRASGIFQYDVQPSKLSHVSTRRMKTAACQS